jgi:DNA-binding transcriptional LysR family regulator
MARTNTGDLTAFVAVARTRSFTKAAAQLGMSQSALSQAVRELEDRVGLRLFTRTTRSVSLTQAGERLLETIGPHLDGIEMGLAQLSTMRESIAGTVRITADEHAVNEVLWPKLRAILPRYPEIVVELVTDYGLTDIAAEGYDAGVRPGGIVSKDMIAVPIGPPLRMAVVGSPAYFRNHAKPTEPQDLTVHRCINLRLPTHGGLYTWEFDREGREFRVRVEGPLVFNTVTMIMRAAVDGFGLAYLAEVQVQPLLDSGELVRVLDDWCEPFAGYHLYYTSRRQHAPAFAVIVEALRHRIAG